MEMRAVEGKEVRPADALKKGLKDSLEPMTGLINNRPVCVFGVVPFEQDETIGAIWLMGTNDIFDHKVTFLRESVVWLDRLSKPFRAVCNVVDKRNTLHVRWLKWLGFSIITEIPEYGESKLPFYEFIKLSTDV